MHKKDKFILRSSVYIALLCHGLKANIVIQYLMGSRPHDKFLQQGHQLMGSHTWYNPQILQTTVGNPHFFFMLGLKKYYQSNITINEWWNTPMCAFSVIILSSSEADKLIMSRLFFFHSAQWNNSIFLKLP